MLSETCLDEDGVHSPRFGATVMLFWSSEGSSACIATTVLLKFLDL